MTTATTAVLTDIETPAALIEQPRMQRNIDRMQERMNALGVRFRPHAKTAKCTAVTRVQTAAGAQGITVSTLKEAAQFFADGVTDILYAVGMVPTKLPQALALRRQGCALIIITDSLAGAAAIAEFGRAQGEVFDVLIEVDTDGHRSGIQPEDAALIAVGRALQGGGMRVAGVMTHAGGSYDLNTPEALTALAEQERAGCVRAAERLRAAGLPCAVVSVGSTPTALSARSLDGVTEVRAGVYVFFDLVMHNVGVCSTDDIALSVLTRVIGHQVDKGWVMVDAGWMAMSRDRGTQKQARDFGYGQVCDVHGRVLPGYVLTGANQEHGILSRDDGAAGTDGATKAEQASDITQQFPIGMPLRILPNHACATGAQYGQYVVVDGDAVVATWERFGGW